MGTRTEPTPEEVGAFTVLLTGLVAAAQEMGVEKVCLQIAESQADATSANAVVLAQVAKYTEKVELAKIGLEAQWEAVQDWLNRHMPEGTLPESCRRG